jgi:hypothetical protein
VYPSLLGAGGAACADPAPHDESHALEDGLQQGNRAACAQPVTATKPLAARRAAECFLIFVFAADPRRFSPIFFFLTRPWQAEGIP